MTWANPSRTKYGGGYFETRDSEEVEHLRVVLEADKLRCTTAQNYWLEGQGLPLITDCESGFTPAHATARAVLGWAQTYHCRSWSRWYNPQTGRMEGRAHCTCDRCF